MSHHYSGPEWGFPRGDARLDLTDLYAFPKPIGLAGPAAVIIKDGGADLRNLSLSLSGGRLTIEGRAGSKLDLKAIARAVPLSAADILAGRARRRHDGADGRCADEDAQDAVRWPTDELRRLLADRREGIGQRHQLCRRLRCPGSGRQSRRLHSGL